MRWKKRFYVDGEIRIRKRFLIFSLCIDGESRWLEIAKWEEQLEKKYDPSYGYTYYDWKPKRWINE